MRKIAKRKMIERGIAQQETQRIMVNWPRCSHGNYPNLCPQCKPQQEIPF